MSIASLSVIGFAEGWRSLSRGRLVFLALLALGTGSNAIYAHPPLVAFAVLSGVTVGRRRAMTTALLIWLVNQVIGFGVRGYPFSTTAFIWGVVMGLGTVLVSALASLRPRFSQTAWLGHWLWVAIALIGGFVLFQGPILLLYPVLADGHFMDWGIVAKLFQKDAIWTGAIALGHSLLLWRHLSQLRLAQS